MNAKEAARKTAQALRVKEAERIRKEREEEAARERQHRWERKTLWPEQKAETDKDIADAITKGKTEVRPTFESSYLAGLAVKHYGRQGYKVTSEYESGTSNMGDFGAPCMVDWHYTVLTISWGKGSTDEP